MSMFIAALMFVALLAVSLAHFLWALGLTWPIRNEELLAKAVVGRPGVTKMPARLGSFGVAIATLIAGIIALALADRTGGGLLLSLFGLLFGVIFLIRGALGYTARWRAAFPEEPFATLDRKNYSPLCLILGAGYVVLVLLRSL